MINLIQVIKSTIEVSLYQKLENLLALGETYTFYLVAAAISVLLFSLRVYPERSFNLP